MKDFASLEEFVVFLATRVPVVDASVTHGLEVACRIVETEAKHEIGTYQPSGGPFAAWAPLAETTLEGWAGRPGKVELGYAPPDNPLLRTGELRDAVEHTVDVDEAAVGVPSKIVIDGDKSVDIGDVAIWQEMGTVKIPPRSFLGHAGFVKEKAVVEAIGLEIIHAVSGVRPNDA